jgi:hypothetical protein
MKSSAHESTTNGTPVQDEALSGEQAKRPYASPTLVKFGTVAKLTQGVSGAGADAGTLTHP